MRFYIIVLLALKYTHTYCEENKINEVNHVNPDGSFHYGYKNNDEGGHYHQSHGKSVIKVRGRYGSRSPSTGRIDETVYTAGPRGFRARGPNIHRKQNLSQAQRTPVGSPTDPLADPHDDPSYAFGYKTKHHSRREESDSGGRVHGEFIYVDDVGEKHGVRYKAGAHTGFEVENGVPDSPPNIRYNTPLYRAEPTARGRITFERGPDRQYKLFLTSSPDQRRAEATGPDGVTRGSYSYLDDKGVQRTVQYIAGAGIGYRVIQSTVGPGTHVSANADVPEHTIKAVSNEIAVSGDDSIYHTAPSGPSAPGYISSTPQPYIPTATPYTPTPYPSAQHPTTPFSTPSTYPSSPGTYLSSPRPFSRPDEHIFVTTPSSIGGIDRNYISSTTPTLPSGGPSPLAPSGPSGPGEADHIYGLLPPKEETLYVPPAPTLPGPTQIHITPPPTASIHISRPPPLVGPIHITAPPSGPIHITPPPSGFSYSTPTQSTPYPTPTQPGLSFPTTLDGHIHITPPPATPTSYYLPTADAHSNTPYSYSPATGSGNHYHSSHPHDQPQDHQDHQKSHHQHSSHYSANAIIQNTGNGWFYGVPPGSSVRAHIQNIDLVPLHDRALSPAEALRRDEERDARHRFHRNSSFRA